MKSNKKVITAAEVVLLIIKNEGELEDDFEYPVEFPEAYKLLRALDVIQLVEEKFLPSKNFDAAHRVGVQKFLEGENYRKEALERRRSQNKKVHVAVFSSAAIAIAGYFIRRAKANTRT